MRSLLLLPLLLVFTASGQDRPPARESSPVPVLESAWERARPKAGDAEPAGTVPAAAVIPENKYFQRKAREELPPGAIDPNEMTIDGRSAAIERNVQRSRTWPAEPVDGFTYRIKIMNAAERPVEVVFWEYQFIEIANPKNIVRRQFLCAAKIKPGEKRDLSVFSTLGPSDVIDAKTLATTGGKLFNEAVFINRVEYSDGAILQDTNWKFADIQPSLKRVLSTPWKNEMCRSL
jgi:hypothetical protein